MKRNNKKLGVACGALALLMVAGASFAYFTDRADTNATGTAGTVAIDLASDINLLDEDGQNILNPGDKRDASFSIENKGNKSIDVRTTVVLTSSVEMEEVDGQAEYELYALSDVELVEGKGYQPKEGASPIAERTFADDGMSITYKIPDYVLNGNEDFTERETEDGITADLHDYDFVLVFRGDSANDFQNSVVTLDVLAEAKQHRNTGAGWDIVAQESYTMDQSGNVVNAVVTEEVITPAN